MKKQILILTFFVLALLAGVKSYGQYVTYLNQVPPTCPSPTPLDTACSGAINALHPQPGIEYTYTVTTTSIDDDVRWFVVNYADYTGTDSLVNTLGDLTATETHIDPGNGTGAYIMNIGTTNTEYNVLPTSGNSSGVSYTGNATDHAIDIVWKSFNGDLPNMVLLVAYVYDDAGCTDNIAVYRILPEFNFTLDIAAVDDDGVVMAAPEECVSPIENASYFANDNTPGNGVLTVDWGENWVYFIVTAANFTHSWMPSFEVSYDVQADISEVSWNYQSASNTNAGWVTLTDGGGGIYSSSTPVNVINASGADDGTGECIVVRVRIDHGTDNEHTTATTLHLGVDGIMYDANATAGSEYTNTDLADLHYADCTADNYDHDYVDFTITPRPEVTEVAPSPFETKTGDGN